MLAEEHMQGSQGKLLDCFVKWKTQAMTNIVKIQFHLVEKWDLEKIIRRYS